RVARVAAGRKRVGADAEYRIVRCRWVSNGGIAFALAGEHAFMRPEIRLGRKQRTGAALARRTLRKKGRGVFQHGKQSTGPARRWRDDRARPLPHKKDRPAGAPAKACASTCA